MTPKEFRKLTPGTKVQWREDSLTSPLAGEITDTDTVTVFGYQKYIQWPDGQRTHVTDKWAEASTL